MAELRRCKGTWAYCDGYCEKCTTTATTQTSMPRYIDAEKVKDDWLAYSLDDVIDTAHTAKEVNNRHSRKKVKEKKDMKSNKEEKKEQKTVETLKLESFELRRATEGKGGVVYFDAIINGIWIYGMKVVPLHDGTGDFVAWPSQKGADGKYYNVAYAKFNPETEKSILKAVQEKLDE